MVLCSPWADSFINNQKNYQDMDNKTNMNYCLKALDRSINSCEGLTQWAVVNLGPTLTYKTSNLNNLGNLFEANKCINGNRRNKKNRNP